MENNKSDTRANQTPVTLPTTPLNEQRGNDIRAKILQYLGAHKTPPTYSELAEHLNVESFQIASWHVSKLAKDGLVTKNPITLTLAGKHVLGYMAAASNPLDIISRGLIEHLDSISEKARRSVYDSAVSFDHNYRWKGTTKDNSDGGMIVKTKRGAEKDRKVTSVRVYEVCRRHHSILEAAKELGIDDKSLRDRLKRVFEGARDIYSGVLPMFPPPEDKFNKTIIVTDENVDELLVSMVRLL